jgi:ectoine hydroxylase-related dioxygenase (phytanoyl-CoA dioxygenase family)
MIADDIVDQFQRDGAVCIRKLFRTQEMADLRAGIDLNLASLSPRAKVASGADDPGRFVEDFCNWQENPHYRRFIFDTALAETAGRLMKSSSARLYHDHMLTKEPGTRQPTPWHQDQPYYNIEGRQNVSFWIPVDPVSRASTLEFVAGSHRGPWLMPRTFMDAQAKWFPEGTLADLPNIEANRDQFPILGWELEPGDVVCFHMLTLHATRGVGPNRRRVFSVRFLGDDITHAPRRWKTSPDFPGLVDQLPVGAPMEHPLFPILWGAGKR